MPMANQMAKLSHAGSLAECSDLRGGSSSYSPLIAFSSSQTQSVFTSSLRSPRIARGASYARTDSGPGVSLDTDR